MTGRSSSGAVLVVNGGSSSIKAALFAVEDGHLSAVRRCEVAGIRKMACLSTEDRGGPPVTVPLPGVRTHRDAMSPILEWVAETTSRLEAVGHRIVHGGSRWDRPTAATPEVLEDLARLIPLAPGHQGIGLEAVRAIQHLDPDLPQILCFDTAFHATMPAVARTYAIPRELTAKGIRRFGFHGLSYEYIAEELPRYLGEGADGRVVVAHLGSGASLCAMEHRRSVATTMGFTTLDGLPMGTRCGSLDPGIVLHLLRSENMTLSEVEDLLHHRSGLFGVSGLSGRMEALLRTDAAAAREAVELFVYRVCGEIGAMAAALGGIDALVFTAGVGERCDVIRRRVTAGCAWLGLELDDAANRRGGPCVTAPASAVSAWVIPTDEAAMIARHTVRSLGVPVG